MIFCVCLQTVCVRVIQYYHTSSVVRYVHEYGVDVKCEKYKFCFKPIKTTTLNDVLLYIGKNICRALFKTNNIENG